MFAKRHYEAVAARLRHAKVLIDEAYKNAETWDYKEADIWDTCCEELASMFARDNGRFDRERFLLACCDTVADRNRLLGRDWEA